MDRFSELPVNVQKSIIAAAGPLRRHWAPEFAWPTQTGEESFSSANLLQMRRLLPHIAAERSLDLYREIPRVYRHLMDLCVTCEMILASEAFDVPHQRSLSFDSQQDHVPDHEEASASEATGGSSDDSEHLSQAGHHRDAERSDIIVEYCAANPQNHHFQTSLKLSVINFWEGGDDSLLLHFDANLFPLGFMTDSAGEVLGAEEYHTHLIMRAYHRFPRRAMLFVEAITQENSRLADLRFIPPDPQIFPLARAYV